MRICPASVQTIPAEAPDRRRDKAKRVPAKGERDVVRRVWIVKRSAGGLSEGRG